MDQREQTRGAYFIEDGRMKKAGKPVYRGPATTLVCLGPDIEDWTPLSYET